jgi:hypothetical protein
VVYASRESTCKVVSTHSFRGYRPVFDLVDVTKESMADKRELHLYLDEMPTVPAGYNSSDLFPDGFYEAGSIQDFPIRDRHVHLYVRRRR